MRAPPLAAALLVGLVAACATPQPRPACVRFQRNVEKLAATGGPDADLQSRALADGLRCLQDDVDAFRRFGMSTLDDRRSFALDDAYEGGRACPAEFVLVIAAIPQLEADGYDLSDTDGTLSQSERTRLLHALDRAE